MVVSILWLVVVVGGFILGGGVCWWVCFGWRWVVVGLFWVVSRGGRFILGNGRWQVEGNF